MRTDPELLTPHSLSVTHSLCELLAEATSAEATSQSHQGYAMVRNRIPRGSEKNVPNLTLGFALRKPRLQGLKGQLGRDGQHPNHGRLSANAIIRF